LTPNPKPSLPNVDVIIPAFNSSATIRRCLESLIAQTYPNWRAIVADDGSTDGTADLAAGLDSRIVVLTTDINSGPAFARNLALNASAAPLVALLDADDSWDPEYLESQVAMFTSAIAGQPIAFSCCNARVVDQSGGDAGTWLRHDVRADPTLGEILARNTIFVGCMIRREALISIGGFDDSLRAGEDYDVWIRLLEAGFRGVRNHETLVTYFLSNTSLSAATVSQSKTVALVLERAIIRGKLTPKERQIAARSYRLHVAQSTVARLLNDSSRANSVAAIRNAPTIIRTILEHPRSYPEWLRSGGKLIVLRCMPQKVSR
jgi:glycosyltransferase involved in cell wall biosynthesis